MQKAFDQVVRIALQGRVPLLIFVAALFAGVLSLKLTPREEEPQIVVPMVDVLVQAPGLSARQVERQVTTPLEKLLAQISGVKHIYSTAKSGQSAVTLRFHVGEDREDAIFNTYNKLYSNQDKVPGVVSQWMVKPVEVDDVPIVMLALWSDSPQQYDDYQLRRLADELSTALQGISQTSEVNVVGGRPRTIRLQIAPESLSAHRTTAADIVFALQVSNVLQNAGQWTFSNQSIELQSGDFIRDLDELRNVVVNVVDGAPVYLRDVADIIDGPDEADNYTWIDFAPGHPALQNNAQNNGKNFPMVTISVAKQRGSNAVRVAEDVHALVQRWQNQILPAEVHVETIRDYGKTANEKVNNLTSSLAFAVLTVIVFIGVFLGWRPALVVGLAVPICYGITLALDMFFGYTINRVTLFALILSLGLLVDDPITGIDNISRFIGFDKSTDKGPDKSDQSKSAFHDRIVAAMAEIRAPLLMSTVTIVLAFLPLAFITGMMGPYMAPMAFNVPVSVITSTVVAFLVTPWLASRLLKSNSVQETDLPEFNLDENGEICPTDTFYSRMLNPILCDRKLAKRTLWIVVALFIGAAILPLFRLVPLKLLPFDNKNEVQIVIDMPESSSLENTAALARQISTIVSQLPEVQAIAAFVGTSSPIDFNGMVRQYYRRAGPHMADLRLTLVDKTLREHQSHGVVLRLRELLRPLSTDAVSIKVVEVPPGPPVLSTLVAEIYADTFTSYAEQQQAAKQLMQRLEREPHVVEIDSTLQAPQQRMRFVTDKQKAALSGVATDDINNTLAMANQGYVAGYLNLPREAKPLPIKLRLAQQDRLSQSDFERLQIKGRPGVVQITSPQGLDSAPQPLVALGELGQFETSTADTAIYHKDLKPVIYVMAELSGRTPAEVIADVNGDLSEISDRQPLEQTPDLNVDELNIENEVNHWESRHFFSTFFGKGAGDLWQLPNGVDIKWGGEGEWRITIDVFRDMGLAFAFALVAIFFVLQFQTNSTALSLIIMSAIPLTIIGIMPGFWLLNQFGERQIAGAPEPVLFTATAMIGMIALAGIVVRNSLILVEFISQARQTGMTIKTALLEAGSVRMRPVLLTAGTTLLGNLIIMLDPVFSGLALAIIFGIIASTLFTLVVVPTVYLLVFDKQVEPENSESAEQ